MIIEETPIEAVNAIIMEATKIKSLLEFKSYMYSNVDLYNGRDHNSVYSAEYTTQYTEFFRSRGVYSHWIAC